MTKELKNMWVVVEAKGNPYHWTIARTRRDSIKQMMTAWTSTWQKMSKKHGWRCIKVNVLFTEQGK